MATIYENLSQNLQAVVNGRGKIHFDPGQFIRDHITRNWALAAWLLFLSLVTVRYVSSQFADTPVMTATVLVVWGLTLLLAVGGEVARRHSALSLWLKNNLYNSITNSAITLMLALFLLSALRGLINYAVVNASFETDPEVVNSLEFSGANWGAVIANLRILMVFRFPTSEMWRIWATIALLVILAVPSFIIYRPSFGGPKVARRVMTALWLLSPLAVYVLLRGVSETGPFSYINPDRFWGGFLLTMIISVFAITVSFPIGLVLALGRRSSIRGIPSWLTWVAAIGLTVWGLLTSTPGNAAAARNTPELILAYWPLLVPILAYLFLRYFNGNVLAAFSTMYIEFVRGVPLITVLFMAIILFPIFLPPDIEILNTWRVLWGFALFSAAYLAENVRGGLQSIPRGQYEAADALGLSTFNKYRVIILPQALRAVIPAIVGQFIGLFKDTTLVAIVGLFDILGVANSIASQVEWLGVRREAYLFIAVIYFIGSAVMAGYSQRLETRLGVGER